MMCYTCEKCFRAIWTLSEHDRALMLISHKLAKYAILWCVYRVSGRCLGGVLEVSGGCLGFVWGLYGSFQ